MLSDVEKQNIKCVKDAMDGILVHHDAESVDEHFHPSFVQHNPWAKDGAAHVKEMCAFTFGLKAVRWAAQGDLVAYHGLYTAPNPLGEHPLICVDIWRVQGGRIVEHWDALVPTPAGVAEVMISGGGDGLAVVPAEQVATHAAHARELLELGIARGDEAVVRRIVAPSFRAHLPEGDGAAGLERWMSEAAPKIDVRRTVASGELVFVHSLIETADGQQVVFDIFRFDAAGRVTDRWAVAQDVIAPGEAANAHPHF